MPDRSETERLRAENSALKGALSAAYDEAVDVYNNPSPVSEFAAYLAYRLHMTTSHAYHVQTFQELQHDVDRYADALKQIVDSPGSTPQGTGRNRVHVIDGHKRAVAIAQEALDGGKS